VTERLTVAVQKVFASSIVSARAYCALASSNASSFPSALLAFAAARYLDCRSRAVIAVAPIGGRPPCGFRKLSPGSSTRACARVASRTGTPRGYPTRGRSPRSPERSGLGGVCRIDSALPGVPTRSRRPGGQSSPTENQDLENPPIRLRPGRSSPDLSIHGRRAVSVWWYRII
jgi:hypothetical protein